jgi:hypothetical protein
MAIVFKIMEALLHPALLLSVWKDLVDLLTSNYPQVGLFAPTKIMIFMTEKRNKILPIPSVYIGSEYRSAR